MAIDDHMTSLGGDYYLGVVASDISRSALAVGRTGIYSAQRVQCLEARWREKYFTPLEDGKYKINDELRQRVCFVQANVLESGKLPIGLMDVIVCQNLLIYYDQPQRIAIVNALVDYLAPNGVLILAAGELLHWSHPDMERFPYANTLAYRRK
jgi:chemotaxis methyl-accepting protein methylase